MRICSYRTISISTRNAAQGTHHCIVFDETEGKLGEYDFEALAEMEKEISAVASKIRKND